MRLRPLQELSGPQAVDYFSDKDVLWRFIRTYISCYGVMVGSQNQGGLHQGGYGRIATHNAVDYVGSFLIDGKARKINNLWRQGAATTSPVCRSDPRARHWRAVRDSLTLLSTHRQHRRGGRTGVRAEAL